MNQPEKSEPRKTHPVLGTANYQCGVCFEAVQIQPITLEQQKAGVPLVGRCSRCGVSFDLPLMSAGCAILE